MGTASSIDAVWVIMLVLGSIGAIAETKDFSHLLDLTMSPLPKLRISINLLDLRVSVIIITMDL
jgi:hypothetical protein